MVNGTGGGTSSSTGLGVVRTYCKNAMICVAPVSISRVQALLSLLWSNVLFSFLFFIFMKGRVFVAAFLFLARVDHDCLSA
jgi:hypothetical protein